MVQCSNRGGAYPFERQKFMTVALQHIHLAAGALRTGRAMACRGPSIATLCVHDLARQGRD